MNNVVLLKEYDVANDIKSFISGLETENTKRRYMDGIIKFINWKWATSIEFLTPDQVNSITYTDMKKFRDAMRRKYAAGTTNNMMVAIYSLLKELKRVQDDVGDYVYDIDDIERLRVKSLKNKNVDSSGYLSWEEVDDWINFLADSNIPKKENKIAFIELARITGLRKQALCDLKFSDIRRVDDHFAIYSYLKGKKDVKAIPENIANMLFNLKKEGDTKDSKVLKISSRTVDRLMDLIKEEFDIDEERNITLHSLRNLSGWEVYCATKDILAVQHHLNHENIETTYGYIKNRKSVDHSPSLYIGKDMKSNKLEHLDKKQWLEIYERLSRSAKYEINSIVNEFGYSEK